MYSINLLDMCLSIHEFNTHSIYQGKTHKNTPEENLRKPQSRSKNLNPSFRVKQLLIEILDFEARSSEASLARARALTRVISISAFARVNNKLFQVFMQTQSFARATHASLERTFISFRFLPDVLFARAKTSSLKRARQNIKEITTQ